MSTALENPSRRAQERTRDAGAQALFQIGIAERSVASSAYCSKAAPPRRRIRWACCFREERLRQLCTVLTHPLLRYQPLISSEFPKVRHVVRVVAPPRLAALPTQASRLPSEFASASSASFAIRRYRPISAANGRLELLVGRRSAVDIKSSEEERRDDKGDTHDTTNYQSLQRI